MSATQAAPPPSPGLARSTAVQAAGTALSRITGFGRIFAFAYALGAGPLADTYTLANNTPHILYELILGGVLSGTILPVFVRELRREDEAEGWHAVSAVLCTAMVAAAVLAVAFVIVAPQFIRLYTLRTSAEVGRDQIAVATDLLRLFAPQVFFYGMVSMCTALLRARRRFAAPMFAPVLNNLVVIALFLAYPTLIGTRSLDEVRARPSAILLLGLGTTAGVAAMALAQLPLRTLRRHVRWVWAPRHPAVRTIVRLSGWTVGFVAANQIALFLVYLLANSRPGDVTVYFLAYTIFLLPHGVVSVSIISAIQPELADRWASGDLNGFRRQLGVGLRSIAAILIPAAVGYVILARPIVSLLLEHGAFGGASARDVAGTLVLMAIGLPAFSCWLFLTSAYQAVQDTRSLFFLYLWENAVNVVAAIALYPLLGVQGLGLAFAVAYAAGTTGALVHLRRRLRGLDGRVLSRSLGRITAATTAMALAVVAIASQVGGEVGAAAAVRVGVATAGGVTVYLAGASLFGVGEIGALLPVRLPSRWRRR
ncbi:MAG: murein biosynthesis integral membrane protein MurJ [Actinobacteria bacterium]|nr:murein biosynthesis integral membrane protein MurJ [Actinomycetota bacterium]MBW3649925.1 murein biosynthesis integral membrane protein MurJ [Actinomycetota bacterium]